MEVVLLLMALLKTISTSFFKKYLIYLAALSLGCGMQDLLLWCVGLVALWHVGS